MSYKDPNKSPFAPYPPSCNQCRPIDCHFLHDCVASDCPQVQICDICPKLAQLDAQISGIQNRLADLVLKRQAMKTQMNHRHDRLIHRLPNEIVSLIFIEFVATSSYSYLDPDSGEEYQWSPPLLLGGVCQKWRDLTLETPQLWSTVVIDPWRSSTEVAVTKEWLCRSRALPLTIIIKGDGDIPTPLLELDVLRSHYARWKYIDLQVPDYLCHTLFDGVEDTPTLCTLTVTLMSTGNNIAPAINLSKPLRPKFFFSREPPIRMLPVAWNRLEYLEVDRIHIDELLHIILHAPELRRCIAMRVKEDGRSYAMPTMPIVNNSLKDVMTGIASEFLRHLTLPSLQMFVFYAKGSLSSALNNILAFLDRSDPADLHTFKLSYVYNNDSQNFKNWYASLPITHLVLDLVKVHSGTSNPLESLFARLAFPSTSPTHRVLLPHLRELRIRNAPRMSPSTWAIFSTIFNDQEDDYSTAPVPSNPNQGLRHDVTSAAAQRPRRRPLEVVFIQQRERGVNIDEVDNEFWSRLLDVEISGIRLELLDADGNDILADVIRP